MKALQIVFTEKNKAMLLETEVMEPNEDQVTVKTEFSTISNGTERANITGDANVDANIGPKVTFPRYCGYSSSGVVVKKGKNVTNVDIGDKVVMRGSLHKTYNTLNADQVTKIESDKVSMQEASMMYIGTFPMAAIRKTRLEMGESALIMGLGVLGLLAVQFAHAAGAVPVIAADPVKGRREMALRLGADYAFDPLEEGFADKVKAVTDGGVNIAIEVTGKGAGLNETLDCMARFGRVALLGCTRDSDFTIDYYRKVHAPGISLIGAHTIARPSVESYPGWFTHQDDIKAMLKLCAGGRLSMRDMISETHSPADCEKVYKRLVEDRNFPAVVQFDWSKLEEV